METDGAEKMGMTGTRKQDSPLVPSCVSLDFGFLRRVSGEYLRKGKPPIWAAFPFPHLSFY